MTNVNRSIKAILLLVLLFSININLLAYDQALEDKQIKEMKQQTIQNEQNFSKKSQIQYFEATKFLDANLYCPKLLIEYQNDYFVQVLDKDLQKGKITCLVRDKKKVEEIISKKVFYNENLHNK